MLVGPHLRRERSFLPIALVAELPAFQQHLATISRTRSCVATTDIRRPTNQHFLRVNSNRYRPRRGTPWLKISSRLCPTLFPIGSCCGSNIPSSLTSDWSTKPQPVTKIVGPCILHQTNVSDRSSIGFLGWFISRISYVRAGRGH